MRSFRKNAKNPPFLGILGQKGRFFSEKQKRHFFTHFFIFQYKKSHFCRLSMFYVTAKFQKKVTNGFRDSAWHTDGHTDGRTDKSDSKGPSADGGETKNGQNTDLNHQNI